MQENQILQVTTVILLLLYLQITRLTILYTNTLEISKRNT
jgi:hypothetical protein